jgi:hypothetical protein
MATVKRRCPVFTLQNKFPVFMFITVIPAEKFLQPKSKTNIPKCSSKHAQT